MYRRVTLGDRCQIQASLQAKVSIRRISEDLGVHRSTVFREIARNGGAGGYFSSLAQRKSASRGRKRGYRLQGDLEGLVLDFLFRTMSPEQISKRLKLENVGSISHQTIYNYIYRNPDLTPFLRRFNRRGASRVRMKAHKQEGKMGIGLRPEQCNKRQIIGHWERDSLYAANGNQILVCVDRKSRFIKMAKIQSKTVSAVAALTNKLLTSTDKPVLSVTNDNGPEFRYPDKVIAPVYYCTPRRPQERGTVENMIGLIRQYIKRKTDISSMTNSDIQTLENTLNHRPRKCLDYKTPFEVFYGTTVALAV